MGRRLLPLGRVFALDLRNHGDSPHDPSHTLADCVRDVREWVLALGSALWRSSGTRWEGWSQWVCRQSPGPDRRVASIDIAPRPYLPEHGEELRALKTDITGCRSRADLETLLLPLVPDARTRQFLLTNAARSGEGFKWKLNVDALEGNTVAADWASVTGRFEGEALLVAGARSSYVGPDDRR